MIPDPLTRTVKIPINHAYTLISQAYEPHRISHTGNVFSKVYHKGDHGWKPLKSLRGH